MNPMDSERDIELAADGDRRKPMLEDIAILAARHRDLAGPRHQVGNVTLDMLGRATKVSIEKGNTTIINGADATAEMAAFSQIKAQIVETTPDDREKLQERLPSSPAALPWSCCRDCHYLRG